jgi:hypothetical protein
MPNSRTLSNRLQNAARRVARTLKSSVCMGTKRISNSNIGSNSTQCGKFQRFKEIVQDFRRDRTVAVAQLVRNVDGARRLFEIVIAKPYNPDNETGEQYITRIQGFIDQARGQKAQFQQDVAFLPPTEEYGQLKEELHYFVPFMFNYYIQKLNQLIPVGVTNNNVRLNWDGRTSSNASNLGATLSYNNISRKGSNFSVANTVPNWKGGKRRTRRHRRR